MKARWPSLIALLVALSFLPFATGCGSAGVLVQVAMSVKRLIAAWKLMRVLTGHDDRLRLGELIIDLTAAEPQQTENQYRLSRVNDDGTQDVVETGTWTVNAEHQLVMNVETSTLNPDDVGKTFVADGRLEGDSTTDLTTLVLGETGVGTAPTGSGDAYLFEKTTSTEG